MDIKKDLQRLQRLHLMIRNKSTGDPKTLGRKLDLSERQTRRLINYMKSDLKMPIEYRSEKESYCYTSEVEFTFQLLVDNETLLQIRGGSNHDYRLLIDKTNFIKF